jgi:hypothetical protein
MRGIWKENLNHGNQTRRRDAKPMIRLTIKIIGTTKNVVLATASTIPARPKMSSVAAAATNTNKTTADIFPPPIAAVEP